MMLRGFGLILLMLVITGCASYPDAVKVAEDTVLIAYQDANEVGNDFNGEQARWSGVIANIINHKRKTQIDVLYYPANANGRPKTDQEPVGRFRVYTNRFLEPEVYRKGKAITALGKIKDKETAKIDEYEYEYPTLEDATIYLWPKVKPQTNIEFYYGWYGYHPRWYWNGGVRHLYIIGDDPKKVPRAQAKPKKSTN